jgi:hypothetical protein
MTPDEIERLAAKDQPMPDNLTPPQVMLFQTFAALYTRYRLRTIDNDEAKQLKREILTAYKRMDDEYNQFLTICKVYQQRIREGYQISGVKIL